jgi:threonine/homoserine/homoserine lactone efflux protein
VVLVLGDAKRSEGGSSTAASWFMLGLGAVLVVLAAKQWRKRPPKGEAAEMPSWMATVDTMAPRRSLALGVALSAANPKNLVLTLAASAAIAGTDLDPVGAAAAIGVFVGIGSASVVGAVLYFLVDAERAGRGLDRVKRFMARHSAVIMTVILLVLGAKLVLDGVSGVWG